MNKTVNQLLTEANNQLMEESMRELTINLKEGTDQLVTEHDVKHMLKAADIRVYVSELDLNVDRLRELLRRARAAEAEKNREVELWESIADRMYID